LYFASTSNKKNNLNTTKSQSQKGKFKKRVLSSDDEDDVVPCSPVLVNKPNQKANEKRKFINPVDVFGSEPVKQSAPKVLDPNKKQQVSI